MSSAAICGLFCLVRLRWSSCRAPPLSVRTCPFTARTQTRRCVGSRHCGVVRLRSTCWRSLSPPCGSHTGKMSSCTVRVVVLFPRLSTLFSLCGPHLSVAAFIASIILSLLSSKQQWKSHTYMCVGPRTAAIQIEIKRQTLVHARRGKTYLC